MPPAVCTDGLHPTRAGCSGARVAVSLTQRPPPTRPPLTPTAGPGADTPYAG